MLDTTRTAFNRSKYSALIHSQYRRYVSTVLNTAASSLDLSQYRRYCPVPQVPVFRVGSVRSTVQLYRPWSRGDGGSLQQARPVWGVQVGIYNIALSPARVIHNSQTLRNTKSLSEPTRV